MTMRDQMRRGLRTAAISLALCMGSVGSLARADDCSDSLMAESCACQSDVRSDREQSSASDKSSPGKKVAGAGNRAKARIARGAEASIGADQNSVAKR